MHTTERQENILAILRQSSYITVAELASRTFASPSSIRRDLTFLENNGLVHRTHGGVTLPEAAAGVSSFSNRKRKNTREKRLIARKAATLLQDGQTILLDGSSSVTYLLPIIAKFSGIQVYTNNLSTAIDAIELGISTNCLGGHSLRGSMVMTGPDTYRMLLGLHADLCFFSSKCLGENGVITDPNQEENFIRQLMIQQSRQSVFLCDSSKFGKDSRYRLAAMDEISVSIFDAPYEALTCRSSQML